MTLAERVLGRLTLYGPERWTTIEYLSQLEEVPRREIEAAIQELRLGGYPVIGSGDGVRLSTKPSEIRDYARSRRMRAYEIAKGTRELLAAARRLEDGGTGQTSLRLA